MTIRYPGEYRWGEEYKDRHFEATGRRTHKWEPAGQGHFPLPRYGVPAVVEVQRCRCKAARASLPGRGVWWIVNTGEIPVPTDFYPSRKR